MANIMDSHNTHGLIIAALLRDKSGLSGKAMFECVESSFDFNRCLRQGSVEAPRLWQKVAAQLLANVEEDWMKQRNSVLMDIEEEGVGDHQICSFRWADNEPPGADAERLHEEAAKVDLEPKPASLWRTSTYASEG